MASPTNFDNGLQLDSYMVPAFVTMSVGSEVANAINVVIQLYADAAGTIELDNSAAVFWYLSDDSGGNGLTGAAPDGGTAIGTDGDIVEVTANTSGYLISEADGDIDVTLTDTTGTPTFYLVIILPTGRRVVSGAITFA